MEHEKRWIRRPSPAMVVACIALAIALSGTGYAAVTLPKNSVGTPQIKNNAVTSAKVKNKSLTGADIKKNTLYGNATVVSGLDFRPRNSTDTFAYAGSGSIRRVAGNDYFVATPDLPQSALVHKVVFYVIDNDGASNLSLALTRYTPATGQVSDLVVTNSAELSSSTSVQAVERTLTTPAVVDYRTSVLRVLVSPSVASTAHRIVGARVEFTMP